jgi:hypothetical protein
MCDINRVAVRQCPHDFFETIFPLTWLKSLTNLRRSVAFHEAFIPVDHGLNNDGSVKGVHPTTLLPITIHREDINNSTAALDL